MKTQKPKFKVINTYFPPKVINYLGDVRKEYTRFDVYELTKHFWGLYTTYEQVAGFSKTGNYLACRNKGEYDRDIFTFDNRDEVTDHLLKYELKQLDSYDF